MVKLVYDSSLNQADGSWSNGSYSLNPANDGWGGTQFKFKNNTEITLSVPANVVIKQIKFTNLKDNYTPGTIGYVTSEGATVYLPHCHLLPQRRRSREEHICKLRGTQSRQ